MVLGKAMSNDVAVVATLAMVAVTIQANCLRECLSRCTIQISVDPRQRVNIEFLASIATQCVHGFLAFAASSSLNRGHIVLCVL